MARIALRFFKFGDWQVELSQDDFKVGNLVTNKCYKEMPGQGSVILSLKNSWNLQTDKDCKFLDQSFGSQDWDVVFTGSFSGLTKLFNDRKKALKAFNILGAQDFIEDFIYYIDNNNVKY